MIPLIIIASILTILILFVLLRTVMFKPKNKTAAKPEPIHIDAERAAESLSDMIKCKTVSNKDRALDCEAEFDKFKSILPRLFPNVYSVCEYEEPSDRSLLFRWRGSSNEAPTVLMAHYDVVSVEEELWEKPPFDGIIEEGVLWGRGSIDTKITLNGILSAAELLIKEGFTPKSDVYFSFGGDEETNGTGAVSAVRLFKERGITPALVLDEGGAVVENVFPGVKRPCALVGISEKGMLNIKYSINGNGGHSSSPEPHTPIGKLSKACVRVEDHPFKFRLTYPTLKMFDTLGRYSTFAYRMIFSNLWLFKPILNFITKRSGGMFNATVRTTAAFTQMQGSEGMNVIPPRAHMISNLRLLHGDSIASATEYIKKTVNDHEIEITAINGREPSRISETDCDAYRRIEASALETWTDAIASPYPMVACSDASSWGEISDRVYRFSAMTLSKEELDLIHGNNERIPVKTIEKNIEFYVRLMKNG